MTTPDFDFGVTTMAIEWATNSHTIALSISDKAKRNGSNRETYLLSPGTYQIFVSYDGPGALDVKLSKGGSWRTAAVVPKGTPYQPRQTAATLTILVPTDMKLWADSTEGYSASTIIFPFA